MLECAQLSEHLGSVIIIIIIIIIVMIIIIINNNSNNSKIIVVVIIIVILVIIVIVITAFQQFRRSREPRGAPPLPGAPARPRGGISRVA